LPHQCLKCGSLFDEGSTQILRGCPDCKGTRFFYTEHAIPAEERQKLLTDGEADLEKILNDMASRDAPPAHVEQEEDGDWLVAHAPAKELDEAKDQLVPKASEGRMLPGNRLMVKLKKRRLRRRLKNARDRPIRFDYDAPPDREVGGVRPEPMVPKAPIRRAPAEPAPEVDRVDATAPWPGAAAEPDPPKAPAPRVERVSYGESAPDAPGPGDEDEEGAWFSREVENPAEGQDGADDTSKPETVRVARAGEYEIDVKRLLEAHPIVVQREGSYLIHLPSLFESDPEGKRRRR
jgi:predicted  nucleic acid-binding Zn-ribbon protein